ncbi:hypothetical protein K491DRAFT_721900 [Lophiostoma macrostomum CBS 122681]|uniref:Uncharacterized protein n=1 Tax=Lophiostoma macrostomum CBS 122681 TaxID=1314788 RepID=A0A6A6SS18_9PLEO|nr:hypothetical protein K491DRAFT_721900 [Lophiostoma macrostomum CBS 122681]
MLSPSQFTPGTILWLPKQAHLEPSETLTAYHTVPERCFGHPVLVLTSDKHVTDNITILILTSFGGGTDINQRVRKRGHALHDYVPVHPAQSLVEGTATPTLRLRSCQEFKRHIWANVRYPVHCPKHWLQATWANVWKKIGHGRQRERKIESSSLHELAMYAVQMGFDSGVYRDMLEEYTAAAAAPQSSLTAGRYGQPGPVRIDIDIPQEGYGTSAHTPPAPYMPQISGRLNDAYANTAVAVPPLCSSDQTARVHRISAEREPLLPRVHANRRPHPQSTTYLPEFYDSAGRRTRLGTGAGASPGARPSGSSWLVIIGRSLQVVLFLCVIIGVPWLAYLAATWLVVAAKNGIVSFAGAIREKIVVIAMGVWRGILGLGPLLRALCGRLMAWIRAKVGM